MQETKEKQFTECKIFFKYIITEIKNIYNLKEKDLE